MVYFLCFRQKTAYEWRMSDWSSDVCSSDLFDPTYYDASIGLVESWRWLADLEGASGWKILDDVTVACAQAVPALAGIVSAAPNAAFRIDRSEERRVGKECVSTCRYRWSPYQ